MFFWLFVSLCCHFVSPFGFLAQVVVIFLCRHCVTLRGKFVRFRCHFLSLLGCVCPFYNYFVCLWVHFMSFLVILCLPVIILGQSHILCLFLFVFASFYSNSVSLWGCFVSSLVVFVSLCHHFMTLWDHFVGFCSKFVSLFLFCVSLSSLSSFCDSFWLCSNLLKLFSITFKSFCVCGGFASLWGHSESSWTRVTFCRWRPRGPWHFGPLGLCSVIHPWHTPQLDSPAHLTHLEHIRSETTPKKPL